MFARLLFLGLMITILTLPVGILAVGPVGFVLTGTGSLTGAAMFAGITVRVIRTMTAR